ncbi:tryptophan-rich sensory protein [Fournierella massiliensis]|uniref:tryptophan-rich sensory protein n=1 Tax=Allofournierella massiliensis TaxID=1650663 RepID=UPI003521782B
MRWESDGFPVRLLDTGWNNPLGALLCLAVLFLAVLFVTLQFYSVSPAASWLQLPYLLWLLFAGYLNGAVWLLNR